MKTTPGTLVTITAGPFFGKDGEVVSVSADTVQVQVEIFGNLKSTVDVEPYS